MYEWVQFDLLKKENQLNEDKHIKYSKMLLNPWDWTMDTSFDSKQLKKVVLNEVKLNMDEEKIKELVAKRLKIEKTSLFIRRLITFTLNIGILCAGWVFIVYLYLNE